MTKIYNHLNVFYLPCDKTKLPWGCLQDGVDRRDTFCQITGGFLPLLAYHINPDETGSGRKLNISENDNSLDLDLAMQVREYFRLEQKRAEEIIAEVKAAVKLWKRVAAKYKISQAEQELKAMAFQRAYD